MIAVEISSFGPPDVLQPVERPNPEPKPDEIIIRVQAAGVARADVLQRQGKYPPPPGASDIPGLDVAGIVASTGRNVTGWKPGDSVCAILAGGGYAEFCAVPKVQVLPIPEGWTAIEAATLPENLFTVFDNLVTRAGLRRGETILIHGGTSGVGSMAIMLARAWSAVPIATAGTQEKCDACLGFGAAHAINYKQSDFVVEVNRLTAGRGVDVVLDMVGGPYLDRNLEALALEGRIAIVATQGGRTGQLEIHKLMLKRGRVIGSTMRARTPAEKGHVAERLLQDVWPLLPAKNPIRPIIDSTFPLRDARLAHERMESGGHIGKIVLTI
ncbi:MAG TPA: NAD(P)H-quinone oxidoreductase [Bryobacteraceae bacterium]|nr:NAD(P)H-quinone oxidoreductase [Bryobacteraceae bacterium]